jgi:luciferase-type oxidoreductase
MDVVTGGRFLLGGASGDRQSKYPAFGADHPERGRQYRETIKVMREAAQRFPRIDWSFGHLEELDLLPKPLFGNVPLAAIGSARQSIQWIAEHMDARMTYPSSLQDLRKRLDLWRFAIAEKAPASFEPISQPLFIDFTKDPDAPSASILLGFRLGRNHLIEYFRQLQTLGAHHFAFQLLHNQRAANETAEELAAEELSLFAKPGP